jgi:hypothetical protein
MPAVMALGLVALIAYAYARPVGLSYNVQIGPLRPCPMAGTKTITNPIIGTDFSPNQVQANFNVTSATQAGSTSPMVTLTPTGINAVSQSQTLGQISYTLDQSRIPTPTTVSGNLPGQEFPARVDIYIPALATIAAQPGKTFRSVGEVHLQSPNAQSFNPFNGQDVFNLVSSVAFEDVNVPGVTAFTLTNVTLQ